MKIKNKMYRFAESELSKFGLLFAENGVVDLEAIDQHVVGQIHGKSYFTMRDMKLTEYKEYEKELYKDRSIVYMRVSGDGPWKVYVEDTCEADPKCGLICLCYKADSESEPKYTIREVLARDLSKISPQKVIDYYRATEILCDTDVDEMDRDEYNTLMVIVGRAMNDPFTLKGETQ